MFSTNFLSATHQNSSASISLTIKHGQNTTTLGQTLQKAKQSTAKHREIINLVKEKLTDFFSKNDYSFFSEFYKTLSAKEKKAAVLILSHSELFDYGCIPVMYPSTSELSLLWKGNKKLKKCLLVTIKGPDYELIVNMFTGEVVSYVDMALQEFLISNYTH